MSIEIQNIRKEASRFKRPIVRPFPLKENCTLEYFQKLMEETEVAVLFESLGPESDNSRYSFISGFPKRVFRAKEDKLECDGVEIARGNPYRLFSEIFSPKKSFLECTEVGGGGLYGYLSYEAANDMESSLLLKEHPKFPKFCFAWMEDGILLDRRTGESKYFHYGTDRYNLFEDIYNKKTPDNGKFKAADLGFSKTKEEHRSMVDEVLEEIRKGNTFQCQVGFRKTFLVGETRTAKDRKRGDFELYKSVRKVNPSPFMFFMSFPGEVHLGASPELLFRLKDGLAESFPLAGTIRRGTNEEEDQKLALELLSDPKEIAEHNMLVDLHRNDLGRVSKFGTVKVRDSFALKRFSHVQHLSTEVSGIIRAGQDMFSGLASSFPTGTLSGAPKIESMKIIHRIENDPRGPYGGAVGRFGFDGNCSFCIPIRSYFRKEEEAVVRASGGIVMDSNPDAEYHEIGHKLGAVLKAMEAAR